MVVMTTVEEGLRSQLRNIETSTGRSIADWIALIKSSGRTKHGEIVAWLKSEYGLSHGTANRLAITALNPSSASDPTSATGAAEPDSVDSLYAGAKTALRPIHDRVMTVIDGFGAPIEVAPKKGYLSLRRRTQFAMLKPASKHVDLGLILPGEPVTGRLESAATFNALFTHRVRLASVGDVDDQVTGWLRAAWDRAG
jgi:hypothetical protein